MGLIPRIPLYYVSGCLQLQNTYCKLMAQNIFCRHLGALVFEIEIVQKKNFNLNYLQI